MIKSSLCFSFRYSAASVIDISSKYKFLWKLPLEDIEVVKGTVIISHNQYNMIYMFAMFFLFVQSWP